METYYFIVAGLLLSSGNAVYLRRAPILPDDACGSASKTCIDSSSVLHCVNVNDIMVPGFIEDCDSACVDGHCVQGEPIAPWAANPISDLSDVNCEGKRTTCFNCTSVVQCVESPTGTMVPGFLVNCGASHPFCSKGFCVDNLPEDDDCVAVPPKENHFSCLPGVTGYLPDPANCTRYHFCSGSGSYMYECSDSKHMYDHSKARCVQREKEKCFTFECKAALDYVIYEHDPSVYALCKGVGAQGALVAKCRPYFVFSKLTGKCERACVKEERQPDPKDGRNYFECSRSVNGWSWLLRRFSCPEGATFDSVSERCVVDEGDSTSAPPPTNPITDPPPTRPPTPRPPTPRPPTPPSFTVEPTAT